MRGIKIPPQNAITCTTTPHSGIKDLGWQTGQVLEGRVLTEIVGGSYLIKVDDRDIIARSPYKLLQGQAMVMEVQGRNGNQYLVRLLQAADKNECVTYLAARLELEDTPLVRALLSGFMAKQLPLHQELIRRALLMLESMGGSSPEEIEVVLQALKSHPNRLAIAPVVLEALRSFVIGEQETPRGIESKLLPFIRQVDVLLAGLNPSQQQMAGELQVLKKMLAGMVLRPAEGAGEVLPQLQNLLAAQLPVIGRQERAATYRLTGDMAGNFAGTGQEQQNGARAFSNLLQSFSRLLQEVRQALAAAGPEGQRFITDGEIIEGQLAGHQLFQSMEQEEWLFFNLPFINSEESGAWGQLRIKKDVGGSKIINPRNFAMTLMLNTINLGPLLLDLKVCDGVVQASGRAGGAGVVELLKQAWPELQQAFAGLGYQLQQCRWQVGKVSKLEPVAIEPYRSEVQHSHLDSLV